MRKGAAALMTLAAVLAALAAVPAWLRAAMPEYGPSHAGRYAAEKTTNAWLVSQAAEQDANLLIFGSSELKTTNICSHPYNFFEGSGLSVDLVGRGSCQSLIHALNVGAQGEKLRGGKIVLITAPQSYVETGIAPDMFMANYSERELLSILGDGDVPEEIKTYIAKRAQELFAAYENNTGVNPAAHTAGDVMSRAWADGAARWPFAPYAALSGWLLETKDMAEAKTLLEERDGGVWEGAPALDFDWAAGEEKALAQAGEMVTNNDFYMEDGYYNTYIGARLSQQAGKDSALSYDVSPEYDDLRCLLDLCALRDIQVLFVHPPVHGLWNDFTGFSVGRRERYYENVRNIVENYSNVTLLDLTGFEYELYFLCDTMHLGWKGWLAVDRAIVEFYQQG